MNWNILVVEKQKIKREPDSSGERIRIYGILIRKN
jgi:hypothetical protein